MRALLSTETGGPESLNIGELAEPIPTAGQIIVEIKACSINYPDVFDYQGYVSV